ncbi:MAG: RusA family crossover junction endodeoxyribonuclease [Alphaproteobacteria bacterium]|nr:RusA family crossover junction endodeoxyribonuclease [Alphaproteobacteria bacterium]
MKDSSKQIKFFVKGLPPSPNKIGRSHWAVQAKNKREWQEKVLWLVKSQKPSERLKRAHIAFYICVGDKRRHDPDNLNWAVTKPSLDALKECVLVDDSIDNIILEYHYEREGERGFRVEITALD